ncbi:voltage-dependent R-type calcium channel subunit alpha-1E [Pimephales promelas]|nr:voltage-dependent R-type calcium channel subunit alpha-1E [Pimephales promelas]
MAQSEDAPMEMSAEAKAESESAGAIKRARTMALYNPIPAKHNCLTVNRVPHWLETLTLHGQERYTWEQGLVWLIEKHGWTWKAHENRWMLLALEPRLLLLHLRQEP